MTTMPSINAARCDLWFRKHNSWLTGWLGRQARTIGSSEDIASEVFLRLMSIKNLDDYQEPRALMTTVARRVMYELRRRNDLSRSYAADIAGMPQAVAASAEDHLIIVETLRLIDEMLSTLSAKAKMAFLYNQIDGMKYDEIAAILGVSKSSVKAYVAQGLKKAYLLNASRA